MTYKLVKKISLYVMVAFYVIAGINHFLNPNWYVQIMPPWLPLQSALIKISGAMEMILAILLLPYFSRRIAAWGMIALLILIFPANIQMMFNYLHQLNPYLWLIILRLPLQLFLIWWAYIFTR